MNDDLGPLIEKELADYTTREDCKLGRALEGVDADTLEDLWKLPDTRIAALMLRWGKPVSNHVVGRHRRRECGCFDG